MDAITFNGVGLRGGYKEGEEGEPLSPGRLRNHFIYGDILTSLQALPLIPDSDGTQIGHSASCDLDPLQRHFMDSFAPPESPGRERPEELPAMAYHPHTRALFEPRST